MAEYIIDLAEYRRSHPKHRPLERPLPAGTLLHVVWRMVDAGDDKASLEIPYIGHGPDGEKPLEMHVFVEILGGPHRGQGWFEHIRLPMDVQERCSKTLDDRARKSCKIGTRLLKHMLLASRGQPLTTTEGLDCVDLSAFNGVKACIKTRVYSYTDRKGTKITRTTIDSIIDPTDPICPRIVQAGEIAPRDLQ